MVYWPPINKFLNREHSPTDCALFVFASLRDLSGKLDIPIDFFQQNRFLVNEQGLF